MSEPATRLELLRASTRAAHASIETVPAMTRLLAPDLTRAEYVQILRNMQAFHGEIEPAIALELAEVPEAAALLDGARPRALAEDLAWFGAARIAPPAPPAFGCAAAALGALYVIEGSSLGGRVIARHVSASLGVAPGSGGSFYCAHSAEAARERWRALCLVLETAVRDEQSAAAAAAVNERIVAGARATFQTLESLMRRIEAVTERGMLAGAGAT